ncbi:MAG: FkbM family methyltransferase [Thermoplasmata archaeon]
MEGCYDLPGFLPTAHDVVIDAGCDYGDFTCICARAGARVIAFDPNPENVRHAEELLRINGLPGEVHPVALGGQPGTIPMGRLGPAQLSGHTTQDVREVPVWKVDALDLPPVTLFKIDVEGMESEVLSGAESVLLHDRPRVIIELHGDKAARESGQQLRRMGYSRAFEGPRRRNSHFGFVQNEFWAPNAKDPG